MNRIFLLLIITLLAACASNQPYQLGNMGEDGLSNVEDTSFNELAIRPDRQFSQYKKLIIEPISVAYSDRRRPSNRLNLGPEDFQLDEKELKIFNKQFVRAFERQWAKKLGWELTDQPGEDVVILRANVTDFYLYASIKNDNVQPTRTFANESSRMVLNLQLIDSQTGEVILRSKDKKTTGWPNSDISTMRVLNSVRYWSDAYQAFTQWASTLSPYLT
jgi:Protein of unknown function (DUF3313)